jgi:hypothetical protein
MKFLIPILVFVSLNATSQSTICTLEREDHNGIGYISGFCIQPKPVVEANEWFMYHTGFYNEHLLSGPVLVKNTRRAMEIDDSGSIEDIYQGTGISNDLAIAFDFPNQDQCLLTYLHCETCIDDFEEDERTAHNKRKIVYYYDPKVDFTIEVSGTSFYSNKVENYKLRRNIYLSSDNKPICTVWEIIGHREGTANSPFIEFKTTSDKEADYYLLTDGDEIQIVKINKRGKNVNLYYLRGGWSGYAWQDAFWIEPSEMISCCSLPSSDSFEFKK